MPTVTVSYQDGAFSYSQPGGVNNGDVTMNQAGTIVFQRASGQTWKFSGFSTNPRSSDFTIQNTLPSASMTIRDEDTESGTYQYTIQLDNGEESDPQIVNVKS